MMHERKSERHQMHTNVRMRYGLSQVELYRLCMCERGERMSDEVEKNQQHRHTK